MNSKQRRKDRRLWKYQITTSTRNFNEYIDQWTWLDNRFGRVIDECGWREREVNFDAWESEDLRSVWEFKREQDAVEFALRWA